MVDAGTMLLSKFQVRERIVVRRLAVCHVDVRRRRILFLRLAVTLRDVLHGRYKQLDNL